MLFIYPDSNSLTKSEELHSTERGKCDILENLLEEAFANCRVNEFRTDFVAFALTGNAIVCYLMGHNGSKEITEACLAYCNSFRTHFI